MMYSLLLATLLTTWQFAMEQTPHVMPEVQDTIWQAVTVPHDWAITTPFDRANDIQEIAVVQNGERHASIKTGRSGGLNWMGAAWYKTPLTAKPSYLLFDGAMSRAEVYINGEQVAYWPYGYNSFYVDLTERIDLPDTLCLAVRLENLPQSSRWYPGAGLYRHVHAITKAYTHIPIWGIHATTPYVDDMEAIVAMDITLRHAQPSTRVVTDVLDDRQQVVASAQGTQVQLAIKQPHRWSPEHPYCYRMRTRVYEADSLLDEEYTILGIRTISYGPDEGFVLNGQVRKFKGVCLHHDLGALGAVVDKDALRHQLTMLKDMGCDAIRTSHNMPAPELVELCEQMGFMLMIEPFDVWDMAKCANDYSTFFTDWAERDMVNMLLQFRNSPAVVMWSIGNEVVNQKAANGAQVAQWLQAICHQYDTTRPVTCGMDKVKEVIYNGFAQAIELPGLNYRTGRYEEAHEQLPNRLIVGTETASTVSSRDSYHFPVTICPNALHEDQQSSSYDVEYCAWSGLPDQDFQLQDDYDWTIGQFVWTGYDYLGEPTPYDTDAWPSHSSYFGIIDLASLPKDRYYLYRSQWNHQSPTLHLLPHWTWPGREGQITPIYVYTSYPSAEVFVNGKSQGKLRFATAKETEQLRKGKKIKGVSEMPEVGVFNTPSWGTKPRPELLPRYRLMWPHVVYQPGEVKVVAYDEKGRVAATQTVYTAGTPLCLVAEVANKQENTETGLRYITVSAVDKDGHVCPQADQVVKIRLQGATFVGAANGDPTCVYPMQEPQIPLFHGKATFIVRVEQKDASLTFEADGLQSTLCIP